MPPEPPRWRRGLDGVLVSAEVNRRSFTVTLVVLLVSMPTMAVEEFWGGRPMIDQAGKGWAIPTVIVLSAFFVGGLATYRRHRSSPLAGLHVGARASLILVVAAIVRRLAITHQGIPLAVAGLWLAAVIVASTTAGLGGLLAWAAGQLARPERAASHSVRR